MKLRTFLNFTFGLLALLLVLTATSTPARADDDCCMGLPAIIIMCDDSNQNCGDPNWVPPPPCGVGCAGGCPGGPGCPGNEAMTTGILADGNKSARLVMPLSVLLRIMGRT